MRYVHGLVEEAFMIGGQKIDKFLDQTRNVPQLLARDAHLLQDAWHDQQQPHQVMAAVNFRRGLGLRDFVQIFLLVQKELRSDFVEARCDKMDDLLQFLSLILDIIAFLYVPIKHGMELLQNLLHGARLQLIFLIVDIKFGRSTYDESLRPLRHVLEPQAVGLACKPPSILRGLLLHQFRTNVNILLLIGRDERHVGNLVARKYLPLQLFQGWPHDAQEELRRAGLVLLLVRIQ
mmetsp:Transcript_14784/g.41861  ORF Transcript_14784/g.41861 Transcript_14784/m.41861 type:complete len:234 (-) Transcript_14784:3437-4138(-)